MLILGSCIPSLHGYSLVSYSSFFLQVLGFISPFAVFSNTCPSISSSHRQPINTPDTMHSKIDKAQLDGQMRTPELTPAQPSVSSRKWQRMFEGNLIARIRSVSLAPQGRLGGQPETELRKLAVSLPCLHHACHGISKGHLFPSVMT